MVAITHDVSKLTLSPKLVNGVKQVYQMLRQISQGSNSIPEIVKPKQMHCSNREWNRNSAFIMSQFELARLSEAKGRGK
jgi:hypothetical protein